jgi:hypothetical protein
MTLSLCGVFVVCVALIVPGTHAITIEELPPGKRYRLVFKDWYTHRISNTIFTR